MSTGATAIMIPVRPPTTNTNRKPTANNIGVSKLSEPSHIVAIQLKTLTPVGTAIRNDVYMKNSCPATGIPTVNMWCAHTTHDMNAIAHVAITIERYPNSGLRAKVGMTWEMMPNAGKAMMYTSGWPKNQKMCWNMAGSP